MIFAIKHLNKQIIFRKVSIYRPVTYDFVSFSDSSTLSAAFASPVFNQAHCTVTFEVIFKQ